MARRGCLQMYFQIERANAQNVAMAQLALCLNHLPVEKCAVRAAEVTHSERALDGQQSAMAAADEGAAGPQLARRIPPDHEGRAIDRDALALQLARCANNEAQFHNTPPALGKTATGQLGPATGLSMKLALGFQITMACGGVGHPCESKVSRQSSRRARRRRRDLVRHRLRVYASCAGDAREKASRVDVAGGGWRVEGVTGGGWRVDGEKAFFPSTLHPPLLLGFLRGSARRSCHL